MLVAGCLRKELLNGVKIYPSCVPILCAQGHLIVKMAIWYHTHHLRLVHYIQYSSGLAKGHTVPLLPLERSLIIKGFRTGDFLKLVNNCWKTCFFLTLSRLTSRVLTDKTYLNCPSWVALRRLCRTHCVGNSSSVAHNSRSISYMQWVFCCAHFGLKACRYWRYVLVTQYTTMFRFFEGYYV